MSIFMVVTVAAFLHDSRWVLGYLSTPRPFSSRWISK